MDTGNQPANAQPAATPAAKRPGGRAPRQLRYLPEGFTEGTAPIGKPLPNESGKRMARPAVPVIFPKGEARLGDVLDSLPNGEKPARPNKSLTVAEHLYAKEFSDDHGFTDNEGAARASGDGGTSAARGPVCGGAAPKGPFCSSFLLRSAPIVRWGTCCQTSSSAKARKTSLQLA